MSRSNRERILGVRMDFGRVRERSHWARGTFTREFTWVAEFFCAPPAEASSLELETTLPGVVGICGNGLGRSRTSMTSFTPRDVRPHPRSSIASRSTDASYHLPQRWLHPAGKHLKSLTVPAPSLRKLSALQAVETHSQQ